MAKIVDSNQVEYRLDQSSANLSQRSVCVCCLVQNYRFVNLNTCSHAYVLKLFLQFNTLHPDCVICLKCHKILQNIQMFKEQVEKNQLLLNQKFQELKFDIKVYKLQRSVCEISSTIDSQPIVVESKGETVENNCHPSFMETKVKIEPDSLSDLETELPLAEIDESGAERQDEKAENTSFNEKYSGKIRKVMLTEKEFLKEREIFAKKESYLNLPYKCVTCIIGFDFELTLKDHMQSRHTKKKGSVVCEICKTVLNSKASYIEHAKRHLRRYECVECGKRSCDIHSSVKHYNEVHGVIDTEFTCQDCGFTTPSNSRFRYHRQKHRQKPTCSLCGNNYATNSGLKAHMITIHNRPADLFACKQCDKVYNSKGGLRSHVSQLHGALRMPQAYCALCHVHFKSANGLRHHLRMHSKHVQDADKRFICDDCGSRFLTKCSLQSHIHWEHLKISTHSCNKCSKVFKNSSTLKKHMSFVHEKKRPPRNKICDHCGRGFTTMTVLRSHIRTHTGERPLQCVHCSATFAHSAALYTHKKLKHRGPRTLAP